MKKKSAIRWTRVGALALAMVVACQSSYVVCRADDTGKSTPDYNYVTPEQQKLTSTTNKCIRVDIGSTKANYANTTTPYWNNWEMIELERFPCNDKLEAEKLERYWFEHYKATLNSEVPSRQKQEYRKVYNTVNKERLAQLRLQNKDKIAAYRKQHYELNKLKKMELIDCVMSSPE